MTSFEGKLRTLAVSLFNINAIKFGEYKTKSGLMTPVYCDLRVVVSSPPTLILLAELIGEVMGPLDFKLICGVPYTGLPIATAVSIKSNVPMVMRRKEAKDYGTKNLVDGIFEPGDKCLVIEDVVTSGGSILETVEDLKKSQIQCTDAVVLLNRQQGGEHCLSQKNIKMHALISLTDLMQILNEEKCIGDEDVAKVKQYIASNQIDPKTHTNSINRLTMSFSERAQHSRNKAAQQILKIMEEKQSNLCVAADLTKSTDILNLAEQVGPHVCLLKTHVDIIEDFHPNFIKQLQTIAKTHNFMLFEDRKFSDIGKTVESQYSSGSFLISSWAPIVTAHSVTGKGVLDAIDGSTGVEPRGVFLLAETSAAENLIDSKYTKSTLSLGLQYEHLVCGFVCQSPLFVDKPGFIQLTPGVQMGVKQDELSQQYNAPGEVVLNLGADVAVVGRGIAQAPDQRAAAEEYKNRLWASYLKRIQPK